MGALEDPEAYKNEIWTRVQRVCIEAPDQVEVHKVREDIRQALAEVLDEELYDDEGPGPLFDADAFGELPVGARHEDYELSSEEL